MKPAIRVRGLAKRYRVTSTNRAGGYQTLRESIVDAVAAPLRRLRSGSGEDTRAARDFWALRDVSFDVQPGEVVGIIGRNAAGKSTLLKILSRIVEPTSGRAEVRGRIASLLEVGTGFHPELTGRENTYMNGSILGMSRREIARKFDEIVAFSEIEQFLDTPVKRYSSGMYVRLAFAVAAHLEPEILVVDEVLAVGDAAFQQKCLGKMTEAGRAGRTILFVSHNMQAVSMLCSRAVILREGRLYRQGPAWQMVRDYLESRVDQRAEVFWSTGAGPGDDNARIRSVRVLDASHRVSSDHDITKPVAIEMKLEVLRPGSAFETSFHLLNQDGVCIFAIGSPLFPTDPHRPAEAGLYRSTCHIPADFLNDGKHYISAFLVRNAALISAKAHEVAAFTAHDYGTSRSGYLGKIIGAVRPRLPWTVERIGGLQ
jgi:lipopolysaccharide transport system ATP-binding protein